MKERMIDTRTSEGFRFENTKHKLGVRIWGSRTAMFDLHELIDECWDCESDDMSRTEACSYIGVISYFGYEVRHTFMGDRLVTLDGKPVKMWDDDMFRLFEEEQDRFEVGLELTLPHIIFILASWWECLRNRECPESTRGLIQYFNDNIDQLLQKRNKAQYPKIQPFLHGAVFAANPYLMYFMEHVDQMYLTQGKWGNVPLTMLADMMECASFGTYRYDELMERLRKYARRLKCQIEDMVLQTDDSLDEIEL